MDTDTPAPAPQPVAAPAASPRFLQRIAGYPAPVQAALRAELTDASLITFLRVLHDSDPDAGALPSAGGDAVLADSMLSRLITSRRFLARAQDFLTGLASGSRAGLADFVQTTLWPLADPDAPYACKMAEALAADPRGPVAEVLAPLAEIVALARRLGPAPLTGLRLAEMIRQAGAGGDGALLNAVMAGLGLALRFEAGGKTAPLSAPAQAAVRLLMAPTALNAEDLAALQAIDQAAGHMAGLTGLRAPRPLGLQLTGPAAPLWADLAAAGLVTPLAEDDPADGPLLRLPGAVVLSPVALAWLATLDLPGGAVAIAAERRAVQTGWALHIVGHIADDPRAEVVGLWRDSAAATARPQAELVLAQSADSAGAQPGQTPGEAAETAHAAYAAYALVLRLHPDLPVAGYLNIDNCLVFDGLAALTTALAGAGGLLRRKPVVVIGPGSSTAPDHLITSATRFRAYGSACLVSPVAVTYDSAAAQLTLALPERDQLTLLSAAEASTLPLGLVLDQPAMVAEALALGLFTLTRGLAVCYRSPMPADDPGLGALQHRFASRPLSRAAQERLAQIGQPDHDYLAAHAAAAHWSVEPLVAEIQHDHQRLRSRLASFLADPRPGPATQVLKHLSLRSKEALTLAPQIDAFALRLSESPEILLDLAPDHLIALFEIARHCASADQVAANLAVSATALCDKDIGVIIPLFELLACCLPPADLLVVLSCCAKVRAKNRRQMFRIAECIRRYGSEALMVQYLALVRQEDPATLDEQAFIRCFQAVLGSSRLGAVQAVLGRPTLRAIAATVPFADRFKAAVLAGDRDEMQRLVSDPIADFIPWVDGLRALSNELRLLARPDRAFDIPGISGLYRRKLAAITFADTVTLRTLADQGFLDGGTDLDVIGRQLLGDATALNRFVARAFDGSATPPFTLEGATTAEVFANAQAGLAGLAPGSAPGSAEGPLVSVIMSAFNPDIALMRLAVQSVLAQTHAATELFVVDDASEPAASAAIRDLLDSFPAADRARLHYRRVAVNSGPYVGRNLALAEARGAFIAIHDADDWAHPARLQAQLAAFAESPELRLVTSPHLRIDRFGGVQMEAGFTVFGDGPMTSLFRREVFDQIGDFANVRSRGDVEMRERLRSYYGGHALVELAMPCMLCFADSATLSQKTKAEAAEYLQIFRTNISRKRDFSMLRRDNLPLGAEHRLVVPMPLRPPVETPA